jgi:radical SAM-linked protein
LRSTGQSIAQKVQLRFSKTGALRFLSHHDVMRLFERACRRAGLPVRLTQGFAPHPRLVFATALELGIESQAEVLEIEMSRWMPPAQIRSRLGAQLPAEVAILEARLLPPTRSGERVVRMVFKVSLPGAIASRLGPDRLAALLERSELPFDRHRQKRVQHLDLRPSLLALKLEGTELTVVLRPTQRGAARPAEVVSLLTDSLLSETRKWPTKKTSMQMAP